MAAERPVLVLGASGYVGGRLVPRLLEAGHAVRCLARSPGKLAALPWADEVEIVKGDLLSGEGVAEAFDGAGAVVHLVHSMGPGPGDGSFADADRRIARTVASAAEDAGVGRIVYLGGLGEIDERTSPHLRSRAEVGEIFLASRVPATVLRAAVIIGSGSASFEMLRHLVEKLPIMVTPRWVHTRVQPIAIRDVLRDLVGVLADPGDDDHVFDIGGPDVLTYLEMMQTYARVAGLPRRLVVTVPVLTPSLSSHWVNLVTPVPIDLARPLVDSLANEVVVRDDAIRELVPGSCLPFEQALRLALARIRDRGVETSWRDAEIAGRGPADPYPGDPNWTGGTLLRYVREARSAAAPGFAFAAVCRIGGARGWPTHMWAWQIRGRFDRVIGGVGLRRGRRDPDRLRIGDALDFWRVEDVRPPDGSSAAGGAGAVLRLRAEMKVPGRAWLEFRIEPDAGGSRIVQRALFAPRGLLGRLYWWSMWPFHGPIFASMVRTLAADAEVLAAEALDEEVPDEEVPGVTSSDAPRTPPSAPGAEAPPRAGDPPPSRRAG